MKLLRGNIPASGIHKNLQSERSEALKLRSIVDFQKDQFQEQLVQSKKDILRAEIEKKACLLAQPAEQTPRTTPPIEPRAEPIADPVPRTSPPAPATSSVPTRESEKLPDPAKFSSDRTGTGRFVEHIHGKMTVSRDCFPTQQSRMAYVSSRLEGQAYELVLPYLSRGLGQLPVYEDIVRLLERASGNADQAPQARNQRFAVRL